MAKKLTGDKIDLLVKCATLYYEEHNSKSKIAQGLGVSVTHVKRILDEAHARGIVRISIVERRDFKAMEGALERGYDLVLARVAPFKEDYESQKLALGRVAASLFDELVTTGKTVGIGGGGSVKAMVDAIQPYPREIQIVPMALVGRGPNLEFVDAAFLAALLYYKSSPKSKALVVGMLPLPKDPKPRQAFLALVDHAIPEVAAVLQHATDSSVAFVGLGSSDPVPELTPILARSGLASADFLKHRAIGGINYNYFDNHGQEIASFYRTVSILDLQKMAEDTRKTVVAIAGGAHKVHPIGIALRSRMVNALVTDEKTAIRLINDAPKKCAAAHTDPKT
jgi:DNA-binding transcriptional regulator LsrR (DeoR family)